VKTIDVRLHSIRGGTHSSSWSSHNGRQHAV